MQPSRYMTEWQGIPHRSGLLGFRLSLYFAGGNGLQRPRSALLGSHIGGGLFRSLLRPGNPLFRRQGCGRLFPTPTPLFSKIFSHIRRQFLLRQGGLCPDGNWNDYVKLSPLGRTPQ